jgi:hypothetical protein
MTYLLVGKDYIGVGVFIDPFPRLHLGLFKFNPYRGWGLHRPFPQIAPREGAMSPKLQLWTPRMMLIMVVVVIVRVVIIVVVIPASRPPPAVAVAASFGFWRFCLFLFAVVNQNR